MPAIQIISDLHLEEHGDYSNFEITPSAPYLALIGDIGNIDDVDYFNFIKHQLPKFEIVFIIFGNHEAYFSNWPSIKRKFKEFEAEMEMLNENSSLGKIVLLDQTRWDLSPDVTILGCTLFSNISPEQKQRMKSSLSDFSFIDYWSVDKHNEAHASDLAWLNKQVEHISKDESHRKIIILTHHCPTTSSRATDSRHDNSNISSGFMSDLSREICWKRSAVKIWVFGHTHFNVDYTEDGKRMVTNQKGYRYRRAPGFDLKKRIEF